MRGPMRLVETISRSGGVLRRYAFSAPQLPELTVAVFTPQGTTAASDVPGLGGIVQGPALPPSTPAGEVPPTDTFLVWVPSDSSSAPTVTDDDAAFDRLCAQHAGLFAAASASASASSSSSSAPAGPAPLPMAIVIPSLPSAPHACLSPPYRRFLAYDLPHALHRHGLVAGARAGNEAGARAAAGALAGECWGGTAALGVYLRQRGRAFHTDQDDTSGSSGWEWGGYVSCSALAPPLNPTGAPPPLPPYLQSQSQGQGNTQGLGQETVKLSARARRRARASSALAPSPVGTGADGSDLGWLGAADPVWLVGMAVKPRASNPRASKPKGDRKKAAQVKAETEPEAGVAASSDGEWAWQRPPLRAPLVDIPVIVTRDSPAAPADTDADKDEAALKPCRPDSWYAVWQDATESVSQGVGAGDAREGGLVRAMPGAPLLGVPTVTQPTVTQPTVTSSLTLPAIAGEALKLEPLTPAALAAATPVTALTAAARFHSACLAAAQPAAVRVLPVAVSTQPATTANASESKLREDWAWLFAEHVEMHARETAAASRPWELRTPSEEGIGEGIGWAPQNECED